MPLISVVIPCRNESRSIEACLASILANDLPAEVELEVLVVDGCSDDNTCAIVSEICASDVRIKLLSNPDRHAASAMNIGVEAARGDWIVRMDAHSAYPKDYLRLCIETQQRTHADNVGGLVDTVCQTDTWQARLVQAITTHRFGVGDSGFRTGQVEGPADTVPFGCFPRSTFHRFGRFDERLVRAQDYEFNRRIIAHGGVVWLNPAIRVAYQQQARLGAFLAKQVLLEAPYNAYLWFCAPYAFTPRHAITGIFVLGLAAGLLLAPASTLLSVSFQAVMALYALLAAWAGLTQARRYRRLTHIVAVPLAIFAYHVLHGIGVLSGLLRLATGTAPVQRFKSDGTR